MNTSAYEAALACAASLGLSADLSPPCPGSETVPQLRRFLVAHDGNISARRQLQQLQDNLTVAHLADKSCLDTRSEQLRTASAALTQISQHSDSLALRFKDVSSRQTIPVEPQHQHEFGELLKTAAYSSSRLCGAVSSLAWGASFSDAPNAWEEHVTPVLALHQVCNLYQQQLQCHMEVSSQLLSPQTWKDKMCIDAS
ncbi:hypothetical protein QJQ45_002399 [Haematococcus lacustris]|nr:hypothetical protein QJQ45_002399 [Haematococcus lacustris]